MAKVILFQRYVPHYRAVFFDRLVRLSRHTWEIACGEHPGSGHSGLKGALQNLPIQPVKNHWLTKDIVFQSGRNLTARRADAIVFEMTWPMLSNPVLLWEARHRGIPAIGWGKGLPSTEKPRAAWRRGFEKWIVGQCSGVLCYGKISRDYFAELKVPEVRLFVAQNTIDTSAILSEAHTHDAAAASLRLSLGIPEGVPVAGYLGRLVADKQLGDILTAFEQVRRRGAPGVLVFAGPGPELSRLKAQASASTFGGDVRFCPDVPPGREHDYFRMFDLYLSFGSAGLGILEALAHGRAICCTPERRPETEMLVAGINAAMSKDFKVESFAGTLETCLRDADLRARLGVAGRATITDQNISLEAMVRVFDDAVDHGLAHRRS